MVAPGHRRAHHDRVTQPAHQHEREPEPERGPVFDPAEYEAWRDLQDVLEERDREWWANDSDDLISPGEDE